MAEAAGIEPSIFFNNYRKKHNVFHLLGTQFGHSFLYCPDEVFEFTSVMESAMSEKIRAASFNNRDTKRIIIATITDPTRNVNPSRYSPTLTASMKASNVINTSNPASTYPSIATIPTNLL